MHVTLNGMAPLPHLGVIRVQGEDAPTFLQGQLTNDVALLPAGQARLAAWCSAKGRMLASFVVLKRAPDDFLLACSRDLLPATLKRLSMFVLRAKAKLTDATADWPLAGIAGEAAEAVAPGAQPSWSGRAVGEAHAVELPSFEGTRRLLWFGPAPSGPVLEPGAWAAGEVLAGVATISQPVVDAFVPQMLNYESVGGINFKKGCYPGQEVVARSQFRGTIKRRGYIVRGDGELAAGMEVYGADPEQPVGTIAQAAPSPAGGAVAIASLQVVAAEAGGLHAGAADGPSLRLLPLPYRLVEDV